jgi:hypothetical protein
MEKDPAPFAAPGGIHRGVGHSPMAEEIPFVARSMEHKGIVGKLCNRHFLCVHHDLERFDPLTHRGSDTRIGVRRRPYPEAGRDHGGGNGKQTDLAHPKSPVLQPFVESGMPDRDFGRCDGHHEMVD